MVKFSKNFWSTISMEFVERGSYYSVMSVLSVYLSMSVASGGLGLEKEQVGVILSLTTPITFFMPIFAGALAERYGYRLILFIAFVLMSMGYLFSGLSTGYHMVLWSLILMSVGAGMFKPVVSGTIAHETTPSNSTVGFGIFYLSVNLGSFLLPLIFVPMLKSISWNYIFYMAAIFTGSLIFTNIFLYKEPKRETTTKSLKDVASNTLKVLLDKRFMSLIVIYAGFWVIYFQMFGPVLWYLQESVDTTPVNSAVNSFLSLFIENPTWEFDIEYVTILNALTIVSLQIVISSIVQRFKSLPTMITGICMGSIGMGILAFSNSVWIFIVGIIIFSIGEMTAQPKYNSYVGLIAPPDKKALYMGYSFLTNVIGSAIAGVLGAVMYNYFTVTLQNVRLLWLTFAAIGLLSALGLYIFNKHNKQNV